MGDIWCRRGHIKLSPCFIEERTYSQIHFRCLWIRQKACEEYGLHRKSLHNFIWNSVYKVCVWEVSLRGIHLHPGSSSLLCTYFITPNDSVQMTEVSLIQVSIKGSSVSPLPLSPAPTTTPAIMGCINTH